MSPATPTLGDHDRYSNTLEFVGSDLVLVVWPGRLDQSSLLGEEQRERLGVAYVEAMQATLGERWTVRLARSGNEFDGIYVDGNHIMTTDLDIEVGAANDLFWAAAEELDRSGGGLDL